MIAFDAASQGSFNVDPYLGTTLTISHTCSGDNRMLLVNLSSYAANSTSLCTGITYDGVSLTKLIQGTYNPDLALVEMWGLVAPNTGTHNIVISFSQSTYARAVCASYTGVKQTGFPDNSVEEMTASAASSKSTNITTVADNCWIACGALGQATQANSTGASRGLEQTYAFLFDSNAAKTPAGVYTSTSTSGGTYRMNHVVISFAPFIPTTSIKKIGGVLYASIKKVGGVAIASVKKVAGLA